MYEFLRILPMSVADWLNEWFESDLLKAALAASGVLGSFVGPRQQGTTFNLLHHQLGESNGALRMAGFVRGGIGQLPQALAKASQRFGAEIRTGAEVIKIFTKDGAATGIVLENGEEIHAAQVISSADVKRTFLKLVEPTYLDPHFLLQVQNIRARGTVAKVNLALDALPKFKSANNHAAAALGGVIHIGPTLDYLERACDDAKYGRLSAQPFLEITIPSIADPSLAPAGKHVMSVGMQSAPYDLRGSDWNQQRDTLGDTVVHLIEEYAPGFKNSSPAPPDSHAARPGTGIRSHGRPSLPRRNGSRPNFLHAPGSWLVALSHADRKSLPLRFRHASRRRRYRTPRLLRRQGNSQESFAPKVAFT